MGETSAISRWKIASTCLKVVVRLHLLALIGLISSLAYICLYAPMVIKHDMDLEIFNKTVPQNNMYGLTVGFTFNNIYLGFFPLLLLWNVYGFRTTVFLLPFNMIMILLTLPLIITHYITQDLYKKTSGLYIPILYVIYFFGLIVNFTWFGRRHQRMKNTIVIFGGSMGLCYLFGGLVDFLIVPIYIDTTETGRFGIRVIFCPCLFIVMVLAVRILARGVHKLSTTYRVGSLEMVATTALPRSVSVRSWEVSDSSDSITNSTGTTTIPTAATTTTTTDESDIPSFTIPRLSSEFFSKSTSNLTLSKTTSSPNVPLPNDSLFFIKRDPGIDEENIYLKHNRNRIKRAIMLCFLPLLLRSFVGRILYIQIPSLVAVGYSSFIVSVVDIVLKLLHWNRKHIMSLYSEEMSSNAKLDFMMLHPSGDDFYAMFLNFEKVIEVIGICYATAMQIWYQHMFEESPDYMYTLASFLVQYGIEAISHLVGTYLEILHNIPAANIIEVPTMLTVRKYFKMMTTTSIFMAVICTWRGLFLLSGNYTAT